MIVRLHSQYESVGETATLYLTGSLRPGEEDVLYRTLVALPSHIRVVRVDLNALEHPLSGTLPMIERMNHQLELVGDTATLYITGSLGRDHVDTLIGVCAAAPARARTLRLDLHGLGQLSAESITAVRQLLRFWRDTRQGEFRLTTSHMLATLREVTDARTPAPADWRTPRVNEALVATYL